MEVINIRTWQAYGPVALECQLEYFQVYMSHYTWFDELRFGHIRTSFIAVSNYPFIARMRGKEWPLRIRSAGIVWECTVICIFVNFYEFYGFDFSF